MRILSIQPTPNPNAFKFVVDHKLVASGVRELKKGQPGAADPLGERLLAIQGVSGVFLCDNFVTVTMADGADWRAVNESVSQALSNWQEQGGGPAPFVQKILEPGKAAGDADLMQRINEVLDDRVRPALAGDGGGLEILELQGKTLRIRYQGACGSCPSSIAGTLMAIENMLQSEVDEEIRVVPA
jgi:Fe-S cluster biogenesis protein NfuA